MRYDRYNREDNTLSYFRVDKEDVGLKQFEEFIDDNEYEYYIKMNKGGALIKFERILKDENGQAIGVRFRHYKSDVVVNLRFADINKAIADNELIKMYKNADKRIKDLKQMREKTVQVKSYDTKKINRFGYMYMEVEKGHYEDSDVYVVSNKTCFNVKSALCVYATMFFIRFGTSEAPFNYAKKGLRGFYFRSDVSNELINNRLDEGNLQLIHKTFMNLGEITYNAGKQYGIRLFRSESTEDRYSILENIFKSMGYDVYKSDNNETEIDGMSWKIYTAYGRGCDVAVRYLIDTYVNTILYENYSEIDKDSFDQLNNLACYLIADAIGEVYTMQSLVNIVRNILKDENLDLNTVFRVMKEVVKKFSEGIEYEIDNE